MTSISFFELGVEDAEKGRAFYGAMFGWEFETGPAMQGYGISTGGIPGGMHPGDKGAWPYAFFQVADLDAALERVTQLGGEIQEGFDGDDKPENVKKFGRFKFCKDDQGSPFGLHQPPPS